MVDAGSLTEVTIGGVDVTSFIINDGWRSPEKINSAINEATIFLSKGVDSVVTLVNRQAVIIKRGKSTGTENVLFSGFVEMFAPRGAIYEVLCENTLGQLQRVQVNNTYDRNNDSQAGVLSAIAKDLVESFGGLTATVVNSTSYSDPIDVFPCVKDFVLERLERLREVLDWVVRWDPETSKVLFEPKGQVVHPTTFRYNTSGTTNIHRTPKWERDSVDLVNRVEVVGKKLTDTQTQTFSGDGSETTFTLDNVPEQVSVSVGGVAQTLGITGVSSSFDFTVKEHLKQIVFESGSVPVVGSNNVSVEYGVALPPTVEIDDDNSISLYSPDDPTTGEKLPFSRSWFFDDVTTVPDAEKRAQELLLHFANPLLSTVLEVAHPETPIRAGMSVRVVDTVNEIDAFFTVLEVLHQWPSPVDIIHIGQERIFQKDNLSAIRDRLRKLEKKEGANVSLVSKRRDLNDDTRIYSVLETYLRNTEFDGAWGKGFGDGSTTDKLNWLGTNALWQDTYTNDPALFALNWEGDVAEFDFTDDTLLSGTATVDVISDFDVVFGSAETLIMRAHLNYEGTDSAITNINSINVRIPSDRLTGSLTSVEVKSASGGSYETIVGDITATEGADHTFSVAGPLVDIRITASSATLSAKDSTDLNKIKTVVFCGVLT